ncbi:MAG TPA: Na+/H+ antiporter NhaC family protein [Bacteroidota bacterium]|nr:Na+/H+ antiporter NhaC family protein [Bacteroidota bacterium]
MNSRFSFNTLAMIFGVVFMVAAATWFVEGGEYARELRNGRTVVVPGSFSAVPAAPQGLGAIFMSPIKGFMQASQIIAFLFVIGGSFMMIQATGALAVSVQHLAHTFSRKPHLQRFFIPVTMTLFSIGGAVIGMAESAMPFVLIFIPLALSLGYDSIVGMSIPFLGAAAGFAGAVLNPFTVGIAQGIAELPLYSGIEYRLIIWVISTVSMIAFVMMHAARVKKDPASSPVYQLDQDRRKDLRIDTETPAAFTPQHKLVLTVFAFAMIALVLGVLNFGWFISEIAALFLALGIVCGLAGKLSIQQMTDSFREGARGMIGVALIIGCARAILVVANDGKILDAMLYGLSNTITLVHPVLAAQAMFVTQCIINFFVHSGSGQAALTMPIMSPLADAVGITRQTAVLAFQFGEGWINPVLPTSGVTMGVLGMAGIAWERWFRWILPLQIYFVAVAMILLAIAYFIHYQ